MLIVPSGWPVAASASIIFAFISTPSGAADGVLLLGALDLDAARQRFGVEHAQHHPAVAQQLLLVALLGLGARLAVPAGHVVPGLEAMVLEQEGAHRFGARLAEPPVVLGAAAG